MMYVTYQRERAHQAVVKAHITNIKYVCAFWRLHEHYTAHED